MSTKKEYEAKPADNPKPYQRQWAVWHGNWEMATCWSEEAADWIAEIMNAGYQAVLEKRITEALTGSQLGEVPEESSISK